MPRSAVAGFLGGSNRSRALTANAERTVNLFLARTQSGNAKSPSYFQRRPGLRPFAQVEDSPGRVIYEQNGRTFCIVGTTFAEVNSDGTTTAYGTVTAATSTLPAAMVGNGTAGHQIFVISGGDGYIFDITSNTLTEITEANYPGTGFPIGEAAGCDFLDGYFIVLIVNSRRYQISDLYDGTSWDALDVAERSSTADNVVAIKVIHQELWTFGNQTTQPWWDTGDALFPFAPVPNGLVEVGSASHQVVRADVGNHVTIAWISQDERGAGVLKIANGYAGQTASILSVDLAWQDSDDLAAATFFCAQIDGYPFLVVTIPDLPTSWVIDGNHPSDWVEWGLWNTTTCEYEPFLGNSHSYSFGKHLVTDRLSGVIWELAMDATSDSEAA